MNEEFEDFEKNDTIFCTLCGDNIPIKRAIFASYRNVSLVPE